MQITKSVVAIVLLAMSGLVQANLITNGGFEDIDGQSLNRGGGTWDYFSSIPGWTGVNNIEIQVVGGQSSFAPSSPNGSGSLYAELNAHPSQNQSFAFYQDVATDVGHIYLVNFYAQKRGNDGNFSVLAGDLNQVISTHINDVWTLYSYKFTALGATTRLMFQSGQAGSDTTGHFIDDVSLVQVPEPGTLGLLGLGLAGLALARRRR